MTLGKKITLSALAASMAFSSLGLPSGDPGADKPGWLRTANAEEAGQPSDVVIEPAEPPTEPTDPIDPPTGPTDPIDPPTGPTDPTDPPTGPTDPIDPPTGPTDPTDPPTGPTDPTGPAEPPVIEPTDPILVPPILAPLDEEAGWLSLISSGLLDRVNELFEALAAGDPADFQDVQNLRVEIAGLDESAYLPIIDPIWNKIGGKLPASVDRAAAKSSLIKLIRAIGSARYDPELSEFRTIRWNREYLSLLWALEEAGGVNVKTEDFLAFFLGDGGARQGIEGTLAELLSGKSPMELAQLLASQQALTTELLQATSQVLGQTESYKVSELLANLGVDSADIGAAVRGYQTLLKKDEPAVNALIIAYARTVAESSVRISEDGREHRYGLRIFGVEVPSFVIQWSKLSGDAEVNVSPSGLVTIPPGVASASAVIQAKLVNPLNGVSKLILEQSVTLTAAGEEGEVFPDGPFMERIEPIREALLAGDPADVKAVRDVLRELASLDPSGRDLNLIDPIWNRISPRLPASVDRTSVRTGLFGILNDVAAFRYDPRAEDLEAIRTDADYRDTMKAIGEAAGSRGLSAEDYLIFLFGDGAGRKGVEGAIFDLASAMRPQELAELLGKPDKLNAVTNQAMAAILSKTDEYPFSAAMANLGIRAEDLRSTLRQYQSKLSHNESANFAWLVATVRSQAAPTVKISANGRQHQYGLTFQGVALPSSNLRWSKVSGDKDVKVDSNGKVTISNKVAKGTAVIQAAWNDRQIRYPNSRSANVLFVQEVTLVNGDHPGIVEEIVEETKEKLNEIDRRFKASKDDEERMQLLLEVLLTGKETANRINETEATKKVKDKAIDETKKQVSRLAARFLQQLIDY